MMFQIQKIILFACSFISLVGGLFSQEADRWTERDIVIQDRYFDAKVKEITGKPSESLKILDSLRRVQPESAGVYYTLYEIEKKLNKPVEAEQYLAAAAKIKPDDIPLQIEWTKMMQEVGKGKEAMEYLEKLLPANLSNPAFTDALISTQINMGASIRAIYTLDKMESQKGVSEFTSLKKAELYDKLGDKAQACAEIIKLSNHFPSDDIKYKMILAKLYESYDDKEAALSTYQSILKLDPDNEVARLATILLSGNVGNKGDFLVTFLPLISNPDVAEDTKIKELLPYVQEHAAFPSEDTGKQLIQLCDKLVRVHPESFKAHAVYGDVLMNSGDYDAAIRQYEKTLSINKRNPLVWEQLLYGYEITENYKLQEQISNDALDYFPNKAIFYYFLAESQIYNGKLQKAEENIKEGILVASGNNGLDSKLWGLQAVIAFKNKDNDLAKQYIEKALTLSDGKNANALELDGDIYFSKGDVVNAKKRWNEAKVLGLNTKKINDKINQ